jgi:phospholipid transport system substrate-binding protein
MTMAARTITQRYIHAITAIAFLALSVTLSHATEQHDEAIRVVESLHQSLASVMKEADALGVQGRYPQLFNPVKGAFHLSLMIKAAVGATWETATPTERDELVDAFTRLSVSTYASRFDDYSGAREFGQTARMRLHATCSSSIRRLKARTKIRFH